MLRLHRDLYGDDELLAPITARWSVTIDRLLEAEHVRRPNGENVADVQTAALM
ncbi:MAG: hypothetical protein WBP81_24400 [Solirubrobacteraceae bacterium]